MKSGLLVPQILSRPTLVRRSRHSSHTLVPLNCTTLASCPHSTSRDSLVQVNFHSQLLQQTVDTLSSVLFVYNLIYFVYDMHNIHYTTVSSMFCCHPVVYVHSAADIQYKLMKSQVQVENSRRSSLQHRATDRSLRCESAKPDLCSVLRSLKQTRSNALQLFSTYSCLFHRTLMSLSSVSSTQFCPVHFKNKV